MNLKTIAMLLAMPVIGTACCTSDCNKDKDMIKPEKLNKAVTRALKDEILITPKVKFVAKGSLPRSEGKAVRVKDLRKKF